MSLRVVGRRVAAVLMCVVAGTGAAGCVAGSAVEKAAAKRGALPALAVAPGGADSNPCTPSDPCASFDRAYRVAQPGQVVNVAAGNYGDQRLGFDPSKTSSADVVFRGTPRAVIVGSKPLSEDLRTTTGIDVAHAKHVTFENMTVRGDVVASNGAEDVTFANLVSDNGVPEVYSPTRAITIRGGSYGNTRRYLAEVFPSNNGTHNYDLTIDGTTLHDIVSDDLVHYHIACMAIADAIHVVVRRLHTYTCEVFDLELGVFADGRLSNVLVEDNMFGSTGNVNASLALNTNTTSWHGLNVRNNSVLAPMRHPDCSNGCTNVSYSRNISPLPGFYPAACVREVKYRHNVWFGGTKKCDRTDVAVADPGFVRRRGSPPDLRLVKGSPAIGRGARETRRRSSAVRMADH